MGLTDYSRMDKEFFESGVRAEKERIIKLLEETKQKTATSMDADSNYYAGLVQAIALIKGENK